jgi:arylsulfatase A-like enzyme
LAVHGDTLEGPDSLKRARWYDAVEDGVNLIERLSSESSPWHLVISTDMDHQNDVPRDLYEQYDPDQIDLPSSLRDPMGDKPRIYNRIRNQYWGQLTEQEMREDTAHYWALCSLQDRYFGLVLDALDRSGQRDDTVVIFLGDHGDYLYAHGLCNMGIPSFREAYHVPMVVRWPGVIKTPGRDVSALASLADLAPTYCQIAGAEADQSFAGRSLVPFLKGEKPEDWRDFIVHQTNGNESYFTQRIIMTDHWKYVLNWFDYDELYDREQDPGEMKNLLFEHYQAACFVEPGTPAHGPWPPLPPELDAVRRDLLARLWRFSLEQDDMIFNGYQTAAVSPYGPMTSGLTRNTLRTKEMLLQQQAKEANQDRKGECD